VTDTSPATSELPDATLRARATAAYGQQSRQAHEERLILDHLPLVRHVVQKVARNLGRRADTEDLISAGTLGLVRAARSFDASHQAEFKTYAYIRIRGAVLDELRGRSFAPASVLAQMRVIREAYQRWLSRRAAPPADDELAAEAGISIQKLYRTLEEARRQHFMSIHGMLEDEPALGSFLPADSDPTPQAQLERKEMLEALTRAILELSERDRTILLLYYERDLTMKEAAAVLGVTESRISQLHAAALFKLSMKLKAAGS
jgi:RNA polymerase sigma factor for flagellar operon FliA